MMPGPCSNPLKAFANRVENVDDHEQCLISHSYR